MLLAMLITVRYFRDGIPFNLGWWGFTFPLGVYTVATLKLSTLIDLTFFKVFGALLVIILAAMWLLVAVKTVRGAWSGKLFVSPCLAGQSKKP
jgi:tellurite resistance protein TehA-like permease